jgi:hypothetical protein
MSCGSSRTPSWGRVRIGVRRVSSEALQGGGQRGEVGRLEVVQDVPAHAGRVGGPGVDPHKLSVTIEARDNREILRATSRFATDGRSYRQLLEVARQWPERIWAVEGANGIGRPLTQRLLASGERVLGVPAKLAARARGFDTGQGRKTDATDTHAIVMMALRDKGLREVSTDPALADHHCHVSHRRARPHPVATSRHVQQG